MNAYSQYAAEEAYISVDVETAGPIPGSYSMLSLGACLVDEGSKTFYVELQPTSGRFEPAALQVSGLDLGTLHRTGQNPARAMALLRDWVRAIADGRRPVFVGFNASFDWSFVNWYFHTFLGENPFGIGALDIKAYYMGFAGCSWEETTSSRLPQVLLPSQRQTHHALDDAIAQAEIFAKLLRSSAKDF